MLVCEVFKTNPVSTLFYTDTTGFDINYLIIPNFKKNVTNNKGDKKTLHYRCFFDEFDKL